MNSFLAKIQINKLFHLENICIDIDAKEKKHLIITGKNGSGKTILLNAMVDFLQIIKQDANLSFLRIEKEIISWQQQVEQRKQNSDKERNLLAAENQVKDLQKQKEDIYGKISPEFSNIVDISKQVQTGEFIFAFYEAKRKTKVIVPKNPEKPNLTPVNRIQDSKQEEFLKFLIDLKIQEALARNENLTIEADKISDWFIGFTALLNELFEGEPVKLDFNYKDYSFKIIQGEKIFGFNELSDGYSAIIDIIADLILKMQDTKSLTRAYEKHGIVLIDEIETHLHLELQKAILPMLIRVFPNLQFVVTTHSPFVLNSFSNAVAFDLGKKERLEDLTAYSYEALAEGYFEVTTDSSYLKAKLLRYKGLAEKTNLDNAESIELNKLENEFDTLNEIIAPPKIKGEYLQIKLGKKQAII